MRIGVALFQLRPGRVGGAERYIERLLRHLPAQMGPEDRLVLLGGRTTLDAGAHHEGERVELAPFPIGDLATRALRFIDVLLPGFGSGPLGRRIDALGLDVILFPQQSIFPHGTRSPSVVTWHDMVHRTYPEYFSRLERWIRNAKERYVVDHSHHIICISEFTKRELLSTFSLAPAAASVVYQGTDLPTAEPEPAPSSPEPRFALYPANAYPHKNHIGLIEAFELFRARRPEWEGRLVLTGRVSRQVSARLRASPCREEITHLGHVSPQRLEGLFRDCEAVFFPSLFEGFGIPVVEALGFNNPVVCSRITVLEELLGPAATYFDPHSPEDMADSLELIFDPEGGLTIDEEHYRRLLLELSWENCARKTLEVLRRVATGGSAP